VGRRLNVRDAAGTSKTTEAATDVLFVEWTAVRRPRSADVVARRSWVKEV
jgi:hypothetical protein